MKNMNARLPLTLVFVAAVAAFGQSGWHAVGLGGSATVSTAAALALPGGEPPWMTGSLPQALMLEEGSPHGDMAECPAASGDLHAASHPIDPHVALGFDPHDADSTPDPHAVARVQAQHGGTEVKSVAVSKAANGHTVAEVFANRADLKASKVRVRGSVVRVTDGVFGETFLHLQDGSGDPALGDNDLTVRSADTFSMGEVVEVEGVLSVDQDLGLGYSYVALLEQARRLSVP